MTITSELQARTPLERAITGVAPPVPADETRAAPAVFEQLEVNLLQNDMPSLYLQQLADMPELDQYPLTMLKKLRETPQSPVHHPEGNVWNHTLMVIDKAAARRADSRNPRVFMWAALLHDIGKPDATKRRGEKITAYQHDTIGAKLVTTFLSVWTKDARFVREVAMLVKYHMQPMYVLKQLPFMDVNGMKRETDINEVALLGLCDRLGRKGSVKAHEEKEIGLFLERCRHFQARRGDIMAKAGMRRPDPEAPHGENPQRNHFSKNDRRPVPELQGKAKFTKDEAKPIIYKNADGSNRSV